MSQNQSGSEVVSLNDLARMISALSSKNARSILGSGVALAGCTGVDCGCNDVRCGCRGTDLPVVEPEMSVKEFQRMKEEKITLLQNQLKKLQAD